MGMSRRSVLLGAGILLGGSMRARPVSAPDPGAVYDYNSVLSGIKNLTAYGTKTPKALSINPAEKTLVMIAAGQSLSTGITPTHYTPTNASKIDNFSPFSGLLYAAADPLVGTTMNGTSTSGSGNFNLRVADGLISNGKFDRVIIAPVALPGTACSEWSGEVTGEFYRTINAAVIRLASQGVTPSTTGVKFLIKWNQGESDTQISTSQAAYTASFNILRSKIHPLLSGVKWTVAKETYITGTTSAAVQAAQLALVDNVQIFAGENMDSIGSGGRFDNTHLNDTGAASAASMGIAAITAISF